MTKEHYNDRLAAIEKNYRKQIESLNEDYANANNPYKPGDVFTDHIGVIKIENLKGWTIPYCEKFPSYVYEGVELKKDGTPKTNNIVRIAFQCNEVK